MQDVEDVGPSAPNATESTELTSLRRAIGVICAWPQDALRYDTALGLAAVARRVKLTGELAACTARIKSWALKDVDHPMATFIDARRAHRTNLERLAKRSIPKPGEKRRDVNTIVWRAFHCDRLPFDDVAWAYATGHMRDGGGYYTTHALWALSFLRDKKCRDPGAVEAAILELRKELSEAQAKTAELSTTQDIDLFAEQLLMRLLAGAPREQLRPELTRLLKTQRDDGAFGVEGESGPWVLHATTLGAWILAIFLD